MHSLAVLPFHTLTAQDDQYLGLGLTDAVITRLSKVRQLIVRPTSSVLRYADAKPIHCRRDAAWASSRCSTARCRR